MDQIANPAPGFQRNPGKVITVEPYRGTVVVRAGDTVIASSTRAKLLSEPPYPQAFYIPFEDIDFAQLGKTALSTHCPFKGDASYFRAAHGLADVAWSYEIPLPGASAIAGHLAFYPDKAEIETVPFG